LSKNTSAIRVFEALQPQVQAGVDEWHGSTVNGTSWHVYNGDAYGTLRRLPENSFNCVVTSPPYYCLRDYGVEGQIGLEETVNEYVDALAMVMDEVYRVLKQDGVLFLNLGDTYYSGKGEPHGQDRKSTKRRFGLRAVDKSGGVGIGIQRKSIIGVPWRVAIEMSQRSWVLRSPIIWHRERSLPEPARFDRPRRSYEYVFMFVKSRKYYFDRQPLIDTKVEEDMWTIAARPKPTNGIDTAPYPDELVQRCLDVGCPPGGSVLDPFAGAGTTLRVAVKSGRPATGVELNPEFCSYMVNELCKHEERRNVSRH
jgi:DNA modification methylase